MSFNFTKRYVLALTIIAILSILAFFNLNKLLSIQSNDATLINLSSQQKILTRQVAFYAIYYKLNKLKSNIKLMEDAHSKLTSMNMSPKLSSIYYGKEIFLDNKVKKYLYHAHRFLENRDGRSQNYVLKNSEDLLDDLEKAVKVYLEEAQANTDKLKQVEFYILFMTLLTLFFEAIFIFRPANKNINKKTEELTIEKNYSNTVIESSPNAIITIDNESKIRTYNKMAENIFGYSKEEMINKPLFNKIIPNIFELIKNENKHHANESEAINKKGEIFPIRVSFGTSGENKDIYIVANIQDISKEKLNDKMLQEQSKFAALGEMIAIIAHQWRQPLAQLSFNCMYIKKKMKDPELIKEAEKNQDIIQFMSDTITNFQDFYKKTDSTNFNPIVSIEQALKIVESSLNLSQVKVKKETESKLIIFGNSNSLAHVVLSIIQNIIDVVKARNIKYPIINISLKDTPKDIVLTIEDNADGIKVKPIEDIFKPFNSKKITPSTGIGLYMSKLVIENQFKGQINAENRNKGAFFIIKLPH